MKILSVLSIIYVRCCTCINSIRTFDIFYFNKIYCFIIFNLTHIYLFCVEVSPSISLKQYAYTASHPCRFISRYLSFTFCSGSHKVPTCRDNDARLHAFVTLKRDSHSRCITSIRDIGVKPARDPRERIALHALLLRLISISGSRKDGLDV